MSEFRDIDDGYDRSESNDRSRSEKQANDDFESTKAVPDSENNVRQRNSREWIASMSEKVREKVEGLEGVDDGPMEDMPEGVSPSYLALSKEEQEARAGGGVRVGETIPAKIKLKVDGGQERELTMEELIEAAGKNLAADKRLAEATEARRQAEALLTTARSAQPSAQENERAPDTLNPEEDLRQLTRALQLGTEDEALGELKKYLTNTRQSPNLNTAEIVKAVKNDIEFETNAKWALETFPDIFQDPDYKQMFIVRDQMQIEEQRITGKVIPYRDRYTAIAEEVRKKAGLSDPAYAKKAQKKQETLSSVPTASTRIRMPEPEDDSEESPATVIAKMANARGQMRM